MSVKVDRRGCRFELFCQFNFCARLFDGSSLSWKLYFIILSSLSTGPNAVHLKDHAAQHHARWNMVTNVEKITAVVIQAIVMVECLSVHRRSTSPTKRFATRNLSATWAWVYSKNCQIASTSRLTEQFLRKCTDRKITAQLYKITHESFIEFNELKSFHFHSILFLQIPASYRNVLDRYVWHMDLSHANACPVQMIRKRRHANCAARSQAKINHAWAHSAGMKSLSTFPICTPSRAHLAMITTATVTCFRTVGKSTRVDH